MTAYRIGREYVVSGIIESHIDTLWPDVEPLIASALEFAAGRMSVRDVRRLLKSANMQLWVVEPLGSGTIEAAAVTEVIDYPRRRLLRVVTLGGHNMERWASDLDAMLDDFARRVNADGIEALGRPGFERKLAPLGYEARYVLVEKKVTEKKKNDDVTRKEREHMH